MTSAATAVGRRVDVEDGAHGAAWPPGPDTPASIASTARGPNTIPSSSELDARRLAPWTPEHAASPAAQSPGSERGAVAGR